MPKRAIDGLLDRLEGLEISVRFLADESQDEKLPPDVRQLVQWLRRHYLLDQRTEAARQLRHVGLNDQEIARRLGPVDARTVQRWLRRRLPRIKVDNIEGFAFVVGLPDAEPVPGFIEGLYCTECGETTYRVALPIIRATLRAGNASILLGYARIVPSPGSEAVQMPVAPFTPRQTYCRHCRRDQEFMVSQAWPLTYDVYDQWSSASPAGRPGILERAIANGQDWRKRRMWGANS